MSRRIVGVEMDVWTKDEVTTAMWRGLEDATRNDLPPYVQARIIDCTLARLKGERT